MYRNMWKNLSKRTYLRKLKLLSESCPSLSNVSSLRNSQCSNFVGHFRPVEAQSCINFSKFECGLHKYMLFRRQPRVSSSKFAIFRSDSAVLLKGYASAAEALVPTSEEELDEVQELVVEKSHIEEKIKSKRPEGMTRERYCFLKRRQIKIETEAWKEAAREYQDLLNDMCEQKLAPNLPYIKSLFLGWFEPLRDFIAAEQELCRNSLNSAQHAPFFDQLPADMMAVITMHKVMGLLMAGGSARVVQAVLDVGEAVEQEARIYRFLKKNKKKGALKETCKEESGDTTQIQEKLRKKVLMLMKKQKMNRVRRIVTEQDDLKSWGLDGQVKVGSRLVEILLDTAYIQPPFEKMGDGAPDVRPAFSHNQKCVETNEGIRRYGVIECDPLVRKGLEKTARHMVMPYMPMLVPPEKWTRYDRGAYFVLPSYIMRIHQAKLQRHALKKAPKEQLKPIFQVLDDLGATKWRVNKRVLEVVDRIWACGGGLAGLVDREDAPIPVEPDTENKMERLQWKWKVKNAKKENIERHSQRCDVELKLVVARKMKDEEGFYYPHNLDFRGRAYPMHPHLNHLGSDICRGLLEFAEGRPLGKSGLHWLKIHLANLYGGGVDKLSYEGRISFTEDHIEDIFDSADQPLEGQRWWLGAEDPLQCLATCINLSEVLRSGDPENAISHIPVHMDGSCNGLQHYAALGRDKLGASAVNLVSSEKPADVYSGIAARVVDIMKSDASNDPAVDQNAKYARLLIDQVDRKLVKQTVMTSVYGVTFAGAREQILKRLKERGSINEVDVFACACYAAKTTLAAMGQLFEAARSIMSWLGDCAQVIAKENQMVSWTTPLGLPVVQPYRYLGTRVIKTSLQVLTLQTETNKVMVKRQKSAFPPNFVHSLDGSHMMMTAIACSQAGLYFAGVHDSYWTHARDVETMNRILREKFVELYSAPILENLLAEFQKSFPGLKFPSLPERGDFDLKEVLNSSYFFN